ncbi:DUF4439 domain-containing protein [Pseudarthrobacter sp. L1SW]|uniref:DUF4439 domain-containing protein n=1 Tax=Pseudarthrobacter sp. L1SW TaxID=2851598 RepID=UPI001E5179FC|nr:DUF4439 domain-containing protein [Pseudarthrobacter sp. L1SW]
MKDDNRENRPKLRYFRYAVISFTALLVLSLGFALIPAEPPPPADPPFSEQARRAALHDALELRAAAERLGAAAAVGAAPDAAGKTAAVDSTVTLLTLQARALLSPSESSPAQEAPAPASPSGLPQPSTASPAPAPPAASSPATASPVAPAAAPPPSLAKLASALSASGVQRLADAAKADGGMARLLAGAGTAQLLAAEDVAAAGGIAVETLPHGAAGTPGNAPTTDPSTTAAAPAASPTSPPTSSACPSLLEAPAGPPTAQVPAPAGVPASAGQGTTGQGTTAQGTPGTGMGAAVATALSAAVAAEQQSVYAYQAALPRLTANDAGPAGAFLAEHEDLAEEAAAQSLAACDAAQAQQPGYVLAPDFLAVPSAGLARLELASLPAFGDVIALAGGGTRAWAIAALQSAARRAAHWGGDPGPVPGILLEQDQLPDLPASPTPAPAAP